MAEHTPAAVRLHGPPTVEGESKRIWRLPDGYAFVQLKPTLYSHTANRSRVVAETDSLRLQIWRHFAYHLRRQALPVTFRHRATGTLDDGARIDGAVCEWVEGAPPIEVIVKGAHVGTPVHRYYGMDHARATRACPYVRFDWRNPIRHPVTGDRLADETLPRALAAQWIDVDAAERLALHAFRLLRTHLQRLDLDLLDICFQIDADGLCIFSEISPDCMRVRDAGRPLDKDIFRGGAPNDQIRLAYCLLLERLEGVTP